MKDMLRDENTKLRHEDNQLRKWVEELQEQIVKLRDEKLQDEIVRQKKQIQKLRHNDRQRDHKDSIDQEDIVLETKKRESYPRDPNHHSETIAEVAFVNGSAHATSKLNSNYLPAKAFIKGIKADFWHSLNDDKHYGA